jgi:hypothetical protein
MSSPTSLVECSAPQGSAVIDSSMLCPTSFRLNHAPPKRGKAGPLRFHIAFGGILISTLTEAHTEYQLLYAAPRAHCGVLICTMDVVPRVPPLTAGLSLFSLRQKRLQKFGVPYSHSRHAPSGTASGFALTTRKHVLRIWGESLGSWWTIRSLLR